MKLDFATLAFGYSIRAGGATPNWATSLGQGAGYKINSSDEVNELLKGMVYRSVPLKKVSTKIGKGGKQVFGSDDDSPIQLAALFEKVYVNETLIEDGKFLLLITKDSSKSHFGRLRLKYGPSNTYITQTESFSNEKFFKKMKNQLSLSEDACFFVSDIMIVNQDSLVLKTFIVNENASVSYSDSTELHNAWNKLADFDIDLSGQETPNDMFTEKTELTPQWFQEKANDFPNYDSEAEELRKTFLEKYAVEKIEGLSGKELLTTIFLNDENKENLCYELEFNADMRQYFGSIKSGTAYKYGLHYSKKNNTWATGSHLKPVFINEEAAIELGTQIRDDIVAGAKILEDTAELNSVQDYLELYKKLSVATDGYINKIWVAKYYQMLRPELFPPIYSSNAQETVCKAIKETPNDNILCRMAQIRFYANECHISNILFSRVFWTYATNIIDNDEIGENDMSDEAKQVCTFDSEKCVEYVNLIVYGTPGCGKSYYVKNDLLKDYKQENIIRTTFYQDYTNTDFVGQILPTVSGNDVTYEFNPGPFTLALERAISNPQEPVALVIEELNRGNAPSIFGDVFQLLDRENGKSEYQITNVNVQKYLSDKIEDSLFEYIMIPSNLSIVATMNTSDQNVFTLDTAFKRRWDYKKLKNKFNEDHPYKDYYVPGMPDTTWETFVNSVNDFIVSASSDLQSEDKQLGVFFVAENLLLEDSTDDSDEKAEKFAYKVLEYLWDDVAKFDRDAWFNEKIKSLDELVEEFVASGKEVFKDGIFKQQNS